MTLPNGLIAQLVAGAISAAVGAGAGIVAGLSKSDKLMDAIVAVQSDVRLLKCVNGFPGDCPRLGKVTP